MLLHATDYLDLFSTVVIAWQWLELAAVAQRGARRSAAARPRRRATPATTRAKLAAAQYWIRTELPRIDLLARLCREGEDTYGRLDPHRCKNRATRPWVPPRGPPMSKLHRLVPLVVAVSASLAQAQALTNDNLFVVKPEGTAETAVHKPGRIPWCEGKFSGEAWDPHRILRQINGQADFEPDTNWELGLEHMCQFADDPFWQRQATYIVQAAMNADPDKDQDGVVARLKRLIAASQKARANAGREPTDEERFAFADMHLQPVAAERGVDTAKITGAVPWCDGVKVSEKWDSGRIARTASGRDGIVEGALHLCQRPNDPTWKQKAGFLLQGWMNWTKQTQTEAVASMRVRIQMDKVAAEREALCKTLASGGELAGAGKAYALAKQKFFGCYDDRFGETWQGNLHFVSDETGYYLDGSDAVDSEIARMYWLFRRPARRARPPREQRGDNKQLLRRTPRLPPRWRISTRRPPPPRSRATTRAW